MKNNFNICNVKNKKGISLIEVMIVSVILGLVLVGVMSVFNIMLKQDQFQKQRVSVFDNIQTIKSILSRSDNCLEFLKSIAFDGKVELSSVTNIKEDGTKEIVYKVTDGETNGSSIGNNVYIDKISKDSKTIDQIKNPSTTSGDDDSETATDDKSDSVHTIEVIYKKESSLQSIGSETFKRMFELVVKKKDGVDQYESCRYGKEDVSDLSQGEVSYPEPVEIEPEETFEPCKGAAKTRGGSETFPPFGSIQNSKLLMHDQTYLKINYGECYQDASDVKDEDKAKIRNKWINATEVQTFKRSDDTGKGLFIPETYQMPFFVYCKEDGSVDGSGDIPYNFYGFFSADGTDTRRRCYHNCTTGNEDDCKDKWIIVFHSNGRNPYDHDYATLASNSSYRNNALSNKPRRLPGNKIFQVYYRTDSGLRQNGGRGDKTQLLGGGSTCSFLCGIKTTCLGGEWRVDEQVCKAINSGLITGSTETYIETKVTEIEAELRAANPSD